MQHVVFRVISWVFLCERESLYSHRLTHTHPQTNFHNLKWIWILLNSISIPKKKKRIVFNITYRVQWKNKFHQPFTATDKAKSYHIYVFCMYSLSRDQKTKIHCMQFAYKILYDYMISVHILTSGLSFKSTH